MNDRFNPLKHLHLGDRGTIPLAAGGHGEAEIIAYRGCGEERRLYCRLTDAPDTVVPVRPDAFRRIALAGASALALLWAAPASAQQTTPGEDNDGVRTSLVENDESDAWSAIAPALTAGSDVCLGSTTGAAQTPFAGISFGTTWTDENCENIRSAKALYAMGQTKAAILVMCLANGGRNVLALEAGGFDCAPVLDEQRQDEVAAAVDAAVQVASGEDSVPRAPARMGNNR